jgi:nitrilase
VKVIAVVLGIIERPLDWGGHSVYASVVTIDSWGKVVRGQRP